MAHGADERTGVDRLGVTAAIASITAVGIAIGLSFPLFSFILDQRGYSPFIIGTNAAVAGLASLLAVPPVTPLASRFGVTWVMVWSAIISAISLLCFFLFDSIIAWFILRITFHGPLTALFILSETWINSATPDRKRGLILGIYATVLSAGFGIGPGILALIGSDGGLPFYIGTAIILMSIIPLLIARSSEPKFEGHTRGGDFLRYIWMVPLATGAVFVFGAVEQSGLPLMPVYGARIGYSEQAVSLLLVALAAGNMILQIPLGILSDRVSDRRYLLYGCATVGLIGALTVPYAVAYPAAIALVLFLWGGVISGMYTVGLAHLGSRVKGAQLADANAAFVFCYCLGMILGPQISSIAMEFFPPHGFIWAIAGYFMLFLLLSLFRSRYRQR